MMWEKIKTRTLNGDHGNVKHDDGKDNYVLDENGKDDDHGHDTGDRIKMIRIIMIKMMMLVMKRMMMVRIRMTMKKSMRMRIMVIGEDDIGNGKGLAHTWAKLARTMRGKVARISNVTRHSMTKPTRKDMRRDVIF